MILFYCYFLVSCCHFYWCINIWCTLNKYDTQLFKCSLKKVTCWLIQRDHTSIPRYVNEQYAYDTVLLEYETKFDRNARFLILPFTHIALICQSIKLVLIEKDPMMQLIQRTVFCVFFFFQISLIKDIEGEYVLLLITNEFEETWFKKSFCRQSDPLKRIFLTNMFCMKWRHFCPLTIEKKLSQYLTKTNTFWWWIVVYKNISNQYVAFYAFEMFNKINILI